MKTVSVYIEEETYTKAFKYGINLSKTARIAIENTVDMFENAKERKE